MPDMKYRGSPGRIGGAASNRSTGVWRGGSGGGGWYRRKGTVEDAALPLLRKENRLLRASRCSRLVDTVLFCRAILRGCPRLRSFSFEADLFPSTCTLRNVYSLSQLRYPEKSFDLTRATPFFVGRLESATRSLKISAPQRVAIESWANEISASCLTDLKLQSLHGAIRLEAKTVFMKGLKTASPSQGHSSREQQQQHSSRASSHQSQRDTTIYQLCTCANGKLFLARSEGTCQADKSIC